MGTGTGTDVCGSRREVFYQGKNTNSSSNSIKQTMAVNNGRNNT
jgi:hypothetical protein